MANAKIEFARRIVAVITVVLGIALSGFAETVENVRGSQRESSKLVDIYYDLNDTGGGTYYVEVEVVGRTSDVDASSFSGDVGEGVSPGQNRRIVWDAGADWPGNKGDVKAVVTAIKGGKPNKVQLWEGGPYWADRNIGADNPWDYGLYFWWGDTKGHRPSGTTFNFTFGSSNCSTSGKNQDQLRSEGWITSDDVLAPSHDAAHVKWGGGWRMPTYQELNTLCYNNCDWAWTTTNGVNGYVVRGRGNYASNSIFLPCAGYGDGTSLDSSGSSGVYWSSVPYSGNNRSTYLSFYSGGRITYNYYFGGNLRYLGCSVRPVQSGTSGSATEAATDNSEWFFVDTTDKPKPPTLSAESADWSLGSITLRCEDSDTSGTAHEYTLEYKNTSGVWEEVDGAKNKLATKGQDANGQEVLIAKLTDNTFWSRLGGLPPVEYRVKDENGRVSEGCVTRNRFLLSVGYSKFLTKNTPKRGHYNDASEIKSLCVNRGEFLSENAHFRSNADATTEKVRGEMSYFAARTKPGDIFVFYIATHGGGYDSKHNALLATYDGGYQVRDLLDDVRTFPSSVAVINIIMSCHSFALTGSVNASERINQWLVVCGFGQCLGNVAWVTSCDAQQSSYTYLDEEHSRFGQSFIVNGFGQGCADMKLYGTEYEGGDKDGFITIGELGRYSKEFFKGLSEDMPSSVQLENDGLIDRIVLGRRTGDVAWSCPETPSSINASQGDMKIDISWSVVGNATSYRVYRYPLDLPSEFKWIGISSESRYKDETATLKKEYGYRIRAVNPIGVSDLSSVAIGTRGTSKFIEFLNSFFGITTASADEYDAMEKTTAANGCRTVGECYELGIDPEDPNDDLKIAEFKMKDGKPVITLNHTKDGSGNSFEDRVKILGKAELTDAEWQEVPPEGNPAHRFFKVGVEMP